MADRFVSMEKYMKVADATDASNNYVEFTLVGDVPVGIIAQVRSVTTGANNVAGLAITQPTGKIKIAVTDLVLGDTVSVITFDAN